MKETKESEELETVRTSQDVTSVSSVGNCCERNGVSKAFVREEPHSAGSLKGTQQRRPPKGTGFISFLISKIF